MVILSINFAIQSFPIENGFSVKFNPISPKEELKPRNMGTMFAKIPQEFEDQQNVRREEVLSTVLLPQKPEVPSGYTNQVAKLLFPTDYSYNRKSNNTSILLENDESGFNYLNLPIVKQPYNDYKVLVATAPPNVHLGGDNKQTLIYVVFPEDGSSDTGVYNVPVVYFIRGTGKKELVDPILVVDSNRTVTGIKSKEIEKFVKFKNKLSNHFKYFLSR